MDELANPFRPGAGTPPPALTGRDELINRFGVAFRRAAAGRPGKSLLMIGLRGAGKTVLLNRFAEIAEQEGFRVGLIEAPEHGHFPSLLAARLRRILIPLSSNVVSTAVTRALRVLKTFTLQLPDGTQGKVMAIRWRHTVIETRNWDTVVVPNANLLSQNIVILGKRAGKHLQHRMWVYFNVDYRFSPTRVIEAVTAALMAGPIDGVAADPPPNVICYDFAKDGRDSFGYYAVRYWLTDLANDDPTSSRIRARVYSALKRADIPLARPSRTLFVSADEAEPERDKRHLEQRLRAIDGVELFQPLTPEERKFIALHLQHAPFAVGETVTRQGAVAHWLYILTSGKVEVRRHIDGGPETKVVAHLEAPGFFGEMGMMTGEPRRADIVAVTEVECYRLDKTGLQEILHERPEVAGELSRTLAKRDVELAAVLENLDEEAQRARRAHAEVTMLDRIQTFFGLERTTQL